MAVFTKDKFSESVDGKPIYVQYDGVTHFGYSSIHFGPPNTTDWDRVYLWVCNNSSREVPVTVGFGNFNNVVVISPYTGLRKLFDGQILRNSKEVYLWDTNQTNALVVVGYVEKIRG
jgi:hypothetical protein